MTIEPYRLIHQEDPQCVPRQTKMQEVAIRTWEPQADGQIFLGGEVAADLGLQIFQV